MAKLRPTLHWRRVALASALTVPWLLVWNLSASTGLVYVDEAVASIALAYGVFWVYRRTAELVYLKRHDLGTALGRVVGASFLVVLASFIFVQAAYSLRITESPGPQETQALWAGVFLISAAGIYRVLDVGNRPKTPVDSV